MSDSSDEPLTDTQLCDTQLYDTAVMGRRERAIFRWRFDIMNNYDKSCKHLETLAQKLRGGSVIIVREPDAVLEGGYNRLFRVQYIPDGEPPSGPDPGTGQGTTSNESSSGEWGSGDFYIRLPKPTQYFAREKIGAEAAVSRFISHFVPRVPVPRMPHWGHDDGVGPYTVIEHIQNAGNLFRRLAARTLAGGQRLRLLDSEMSEAALAEAYAIPARCLLWLSRPHFPRIGSLAETKSDGEASVPDFEVRTRPMTLNFNKLLHCANFPRDLLPPMDQTYGTADEWYVTLADMHLGHLLFQRYDLVRSEDDCRNKYVARHLFRRLAKQGRLSRFGFVEDDWSAQSRSRKGELRAPDGSGEFRLWSDDFRPSNILLDDNERLAAAID